MKFAVLMPAAGSGSRLGFSLPKTLIDVSGKPLFVHSLQPFISFPECSQIIVAAPAKYLDQFRSEIEKYFDSERIRVVAGGKTRQDSVGLTLDYVDKIVDLVIVHDAARPFVSREIILRVANAVHGDIAAALPGLPIYDTVKKVHPDSTIVESTLSRESLYTVQTPQALVYDLAITCHNKARDLNYQGTDDVSLVEHFQLGKVKIVEGDATNIKITTASDYDRLISSLTPVK